MKGVRRGVWDVGCEVLGLNLRVWGEPLRMAVIIVSAAASKNLRPFRLQGPHKTSRLLDFPELYTFLHTVRLLTFTMG